MADTSLIGTFEDFREEFETFRSSCKKETQNIQSRLRSSQEQCRHIRQSLQHGRDGQKNIQESLDMLELFIEAGHSCTILQRKLHQHKTGTTSSRTIITDEGESLDKGVVDTWETCRSGLLTESSEEGRPNEAGKIQARKEELHGEEKIAKNGNHVDGNDEQSRLPTAVHERLQYARKTAKIVERKELRRQKSKRSGSSRGRRRSSLEDVKESSEEMAQAEKLHGSRTSAEVGVLAHDEWKPVGKLVKKEDRVTDKRPPRNRDSRKKESRKEKREITSPARQFKALNETPTLEPSIIESPSKDNWSFEPMCQGLPLPSFSDDETDGAAKDKKLE